MIFLNATLIEQYNYNFFIRRLNLLTPHFLDKQSIISDNYGGLYISLLDNLYDFSHDFISILVMPQIMLINLVLLVKLIVNLQADTNMKNATLISFKFLLCVSLLIFARGGIPRFRFDYLTKLG